MKRTRRYRRALILSLLAIALIAFANLPGKPGNPYCENWRAGDIVFLSGNSLRSKVVRLLQGYSTDYSHVGIVVMDRGIPYVVNADPAEGKVVKQRWDVVVNPNKVSGGAIIRVTDADSAKIDAACGFAERCAAEGVPFDHEFDLRTEDKMFCTELVLRAYRVAGINLCKDAETAHPHLLPADLLRSPNLQQVLRF